MNENMLIAIECMEASAYYQALVNYCRSVGAVWNEAANSLMAEAFLARAKTLAPENNNP